MDTCNEEAPIRAGRSPALAAALILFVQNRKGARTAAKTEPSTQRDRRKTRAENQGRKPGLLQTLEGKFRQDPFSDRRAAVEAGKGRSQRYIKPELSRMVKKLNASYWKRPLGWDIFNAFVRQLNAVVEKYQILSLPMSR